MSSPARASLKAVGSLLALVVVAVGMAIFLHSAPTARPTLAPASQAVAATNPPSLAVFPASNSPSLSSRNTELALRAARFPSFQKHPFVVSQKTAAFAWTAEDGRKPEVVRQLAHNELELERMAGENERIYRRQLVYANETADMLVQQSRAAGGSVRHLTLPGFDGQEFSVDVTASDLNPSGLQGTFTGHVAGKLDSTVTLAFKNQTEAFTILSPSDNTYLVGEPREPGELIVKSINPATYVVGSCGNQ